MKRHYSISNAWSTTQRVLCDVENERSGQRITWGEQRHDFSVWCLMLTEEVGEFAKAVLKFRECGFAKYAAIERAIPLELVEALAVAEKQRLEEMRAEAIHVAAVAVAMVEHIDEELEHYGEQAPSAEGTMHEPEHRSTQAEIRDYPTSRGRRV